MHSTSSLISLQDWLSWLESCHPTEIELGLDRISAVAERLGLSFNNTRVITVAGTNGKGSCVASLNALLMSSGCRVGCYTSPHFLHYNERVKVNDQPVDDQSLVDAFARVEKARAETPLTYFEFGTLAALDIFQRSELDAVVLEVGLGGRLDAVNIIDPDIAIVTSIAIDHQDWLGSDREQIGIEKAGIFRAGKPAICADPSPPDSVKSVADALGAHWYGRGTDFDMSSSPSSPGWRWQGQSAAATNITLSDLPKPLLPLDSVAAAIQAVQLLGNDELANNSLTIAEVDYQCLAELQLPGRFQCLEAQGHQLILDVAHNPAAAHYLAERLAQTPASGKRFALIAIMADKDGQGVVAALKHSFDSWFVAGLEHNPRAMAATDLAELIQRQGIDSVSVSKNIRQAYRQVLSLMGAGDQLVVLGSFFTVTEVMQLQSSPDTERSGE